MNIGIENWTLKDWLESVAYTAAVLGAVAGGIIFLSNSRKESIETARHDLARNWTNEGDILSKQTAFIDIDLQNNEGDIIGTLKSPHLGKPLDVHVDVGWASSNLVISELRGRSIIQIATVKIKVVGNHNRLDWRVSSSGAPDYLPRHSELWPNPLASKQ
jgi:hypothetical protein